MSPQSSNRRREDHREENAGLGLIHACPDIDPLMSPSRDIPYNLVDVHHLTPVGARIAHHRALEPGTSLGFMAYDRQASEWQSFHAQVATCDRLRDESDSYACGLEFPPDAPETSQVTNDLDFLITSAPFASIPQHALLHLINCLTRHSFAPGEHLFHQGASGDDLYLIQSGVCVFMIEKDDRTHRVCQFQAGDVSGAVSVLTGKPHRGHTVAESEIVAWHLDRKDFDQVAQQHPELRVFLTHLVTRRLESWNEAGDCTVGKYMMRHRIGTGGWGIVYHGHHMTLGMPVAVKMLKHDMAMEPLFIETFRQEAKTIARLNHPNIVQVFDIDEVYQTIFIFMEYLDGQSLREVLTKKGRLTETEAIDYIRQILHGLAYAHEQGIIHRDIKPDNVFLLHDGRIKILDFGLAAAPGEEDPALEATIYYAPPEQIEGESEDARSDIYALGIMAFELLKGQRPFPEDDLGRLLALHREHEIPDPSRSIPGLSKALGQFIAKCCRVDPAQRYGSAREALDDLDQLAHLPMEDLDEKRMLTSVLMVYPEKRRRDLARLLEELSEKADRLGITMKTNDPLDT